MKGHLPCCRAQRVGRLQQMPAARRNMTVRVVSLHSLEAGGSRVAGTPSERVALVGVLSADLWARTQRPLPSYERAEMPVCVVARQANRR